MKLQYFDVQWSVSEARAARALLMAEVSTRSSIRFSPHVHLDARYSGSTP